MSCNSSPGIQNQAVGSSAMSTERANQVLSRMNELRCFPTLCDVTLTASGQQVNAHRALLASESPYFLAMFTCGMREGRCPEVEIGNVEFDILKTIVDAIYSRKLTIAIDNVQDLLAAASLLQVSFVINQCCHFLLDNLDPNNCLGVRVFLTSNGCMEAAKCADSFIFENFIEVAQSDEFVTYPVELLVPLLSSDLLNVSCEEQVLTAVRRWLEYTDCNSPSLVASCSNPAGHVTEDKKTTRAAVATSSVEQTSSSRSASSVVASLGINLQQLTLATAQQAPSDQQQPCQPLEQQLQQQGASNTLSSAHAEESVVRQRHTTTDRPAAANQSVSSAAGAASRAPQPYAPTLSFGNAAPSAMEAFSNDYNNTQKSGTASASASADVDQDPAERSASPGDMAERGLLPTLPLSTSHENVPFTESMDDADNEDYTISSRHGNVRSHSVSSSRQPSRTPSTLSHVRPPSTATLSKTSLQRSEHALELLACLRLPSLQTETLLESVDSMPMIRSSLECRDVLDSAKRFHLLPEGEKKRGMRHRLEMCRPRKAVRGVVFAIGGKKSSEKVSCSIEIYHSRTNTWARGPQLGRRRQQLGVAFLDGCIYVIGGSDGAVRLNSVQCYRLNTKLWENKANLASPRSGVGVGVLGGAIYAAGGYDGHMCLESVERYDKEIDRWSFIAPMNIRRSFPAVASLNNRLIVVGGNDGSTFLSVAESYEPHLNRWLNISTLQKPRAGIGAASLNGYLYVCGGNDGTSRLDSVERYDPKNDSWQMMHPMLAARDGACLAALGSHLVALGGINGPAYLNSVEEYNPITDSWSFLKPMEVCRVAGGVAVVPAAVMAAAEQQLNQQQAAADDSAAEGAAAAPLSAAAAGGMHMPVAGAVVAGIGDAPVHGNNMGQAL